MRSSIGTLMILALATSAGCASTTSTRTNTRQDDLSYQGHRNEAEAHREQARRDDRDTTNIGTARMDPATDNNSHDDMVAQQNEAALHDRHAANEERTFAGECVHVPPAEQTRCSYGTHTAARVDDLANGVRVRFAPGGDELQTTLSRAHCTHAYSDYAGRETMPECVLAIRGLVIDGRDDAGSIVLTLTTDDRGSLAELQRRAHLLMRTTTR